MDQNIQLRFHVACQFLESLHYLIDDADAATNRLAEKGVAAQLPIANYETSFCQGNDEFNLHRRCLKEANKEAFSSAARTIPGMPKSQAHPYLSTLWTELVAHQPDGDAPNYAIAPIRPDGFASYQRLIFDPCHCRAMKLSHKDRTIAEQPYLQDTVRTMKQEVLLLSKSTHARPITRSGHSKFFVKYAAECAQDAGFEFDQKKSSMQYPAICRTLNENWDLRWYVNDTKTWKFAPVADRTDLLTWPGKFVPEMAICASNLKGEMSPMVDLGRILPIDYLYFVEGFAPAYRLFCDPESLMLCIHAHWELLKMVIDDIINAIDASGLLSNYGNYEITVMGWTPPSGLAMGRTGEC